MINAKKVDSQNAPDSTQITAEQQRLAKFYENKNNDLKSFIRQLEADIEFKEQKLIKYENVLHENEAEIDRLRIEVDTVKHLSAKDSAKSSQSLNGFTEEQDKVLIEAKMSSNDALIEKYQKDLSTLETQNYQLKRQIEVLENREEFTKLDELKKNHVYNKVRDHMDVIISEKRTMEQFLLTNWNISNQFGNQIKEGLQDVHVI